MPPDEIRCPGCNQAHPYHRTGCEIGNTQHFLRAFRESRQRGMHYKLVQDGQTWMVSTITLDHQKSGGGSDYHSERAGHTPLEAVKGYLDDEDNVIAEKARKNPDEMIFCVIGQDLAPSGKPWQVFLFALDENGEVIPFP